MATERDDEDETQEPKPASPEPEEKNEPEPEEYQFSLVFKEKKVTIINGTGVKSVYTLREMSGKGRDQYQSLLAKRAPRIDQAGNPQGKFDPQGLEEQLITMCLFDANNQQVPVTVIRDFPSSVQEGLFNAAARLNGLDKAAEKRAKKPSSAND